MDKEKKVEEKTDVAPLDISKEKIDRVAGEISEILKKEKVGLQPTLNYTPTAIVASVHLVDLDKVEEEVKDK